MLGLIFIIYTLLLWAQSGANPVFNVPDSPHVPPTATKGMIIDAGSGGSRMHIYSWKPRIFDVVPPPISFPEDSESWTDMITPGVNSLHNDAVQIGNHLAQLIDFAKLKLVNEKDQYGDFPIYFYATGGMRELSLDEREAIMTTVRQLLGDDNFCPFYFRDDFARIISGEEEAIFSWAATNFLKGTLLPASQGLGIVTSVNNTYGTVDIGGSSAQIAFFVPSQDISEGLYKLQIGSQKTWNVYAKSFLTFGIKSARLRYAKMLADEALGLPSIETGSTTGVGGGSSSSSSSSSSSNSIKTTTAKHGSGEVEAHVLNYCFHAGYSEMGSDSSGQHSVELAGPQLPVSDQLDRCIESVRPLMHRQSDAFCDKTHSGNCGVAGSYQPPLPIKEHGQFIGTSSYAIPWHFLLLPNTASLGFVQERASALCQMNFDDVLFYYETNKQIMNTDSVAVAAQIPYFCFLSAYILVLLKDGYRFETEQTITVLDEINGHKVAWPLGAILYEINELPWQLQISSSDTQAWGLVFLAAFIGILIGGIAAVCIYREFIEASSSRVAEMEASYQALKRIPTLELMGQSENAATSYGTASGSSSNNMAYDPIGGGSGGGRGGSSMYSVNAGGDWGGSSSSNITHSGFGSITSTSYYGAGAAGGEGTVHRRNPSAYANPPQYTSPYVDPRAPSSKREPGACLTPRQHHSPRVDSLPGSPRVPNSPNSSRGSSRSSSRRNSFGGTGTGLGPAVAASTGSALFSLLPPAEEPRRKPSFTSWDQLPLLTSPRHKDPTSSHSVPAAATAAAAAQSVTPTMQAGIASLSGGGGGGGLIKVDWMAGLRDLTTFPSNNSSSRNNYQELPF